MRFLLTLAIWIVFIGGLYLYTAQRNATATIPQETADTAAAPKTERKITIELTPTFSIEEDPFALKTDVQAQPLEVRVNGIPLPVKADDIGRGRTLIVSDVSLTEAEHNEVFVKASPPIAENSIEHGIRIRLLDSGKVLADRTVWSSGGGLVAGSVSFELTDGEAGHDH